MQVPDTPQDHMNEGSPDVVSSTSVFENRPNILIEGSNIPVNPYKRRRSSPVDWNYGPAPKHRALKPSSRRDFTEIQLSPRSEDLKTVVEESQQIMRASPEEGLEETTNGVNQPGAQRRSSTRGSAADEGMANAGVRNTQLRDLIHLVINESLRVGGRPDSAIAEETQYGEKIEVRTRSSNGQASMKTIEWSVDPSVPETILIDERDLTKLISVVFLNAIKFTESGKITVDATLSPRSRYVVINVTDEGDGIKESFLPRLFGAFSREDDSTTRPKEGLGLGLMVAKGIARRLGGDLNLVRTSTSGPDKGSEFEIKVPKTPSDAASHPSTPYRSPTPSRPGSYFSGIDAPTTNPSPGRHKSHSHPQPQTPHDRRRESLHPSSARERDSPTPDRNTKPPTPLHPSSPSRHNGSRSSKDQDPPYNSVRRHSSMKKAGPPSDSYDRNLAKKHPLTILVAEDNRINRKLLVNMLGKLGYNDILEAFDGGEAVRLMKENLSTSKPAKKGKSKSPPPTKPVDVVLMDLWMPEMDGYEATERILDMFDKREGPIDHPGPTVLAVTADVTDEAISRAHRVGMEGYMTKPYKLMDLERLIVEFCGRRDGQDRGRQR
jgi:CheY-like chemotaxis protein